MTREALTVEHEYQQAAAATLQNQQGYYPAELVLPEVDRKLSMFDVRLVQLDSYGTPNVIVMSVLDATQREQFVAGELRQHYLSAATEATQAFDPNKGIHVSVILIAKDPLSRRQERQHLRRVPLSRKPVREVGFYWISPGHKRFQSGYRFLSLAPNSALNPCHPENNLFTWLLRRGWANVGEPPKTDRQVQAFQAERSFSEKLLTRPTAVWVFLLTNLLVWYLTERLGGSRDIDVLIRCGAKVDGLVRLGQFWRLVTATFLHAGYAHMFINGLGLLVLGQTMERLYGSVRFVLIYVLCGVAAGLASLFMAHGVMVGASGAIFGIVGMLVTYGFRYRREIPGRYQAMFGAGLLPLVGLNVGLGFIIPQIDNAAHIGGLIAGCMLGLVFRPRTSGRSNPLSAWLRRAAFVAAGIVVLGSGFMAVRFFHTYPDIARVDQQFILERRFGSVRMDVPATWTMRRLSPNRWALVSSYARATVELVKTPTPAETAFRRCMEYFEGGKQRSLLLEVAVASNLTKLEKQGLAEVSLTLTGKTAGPPAELTDILKRVEKSFAPTTGGTTDS